MKKIKFFPLKRNGEIAKTPVYSDVLDKEFCSLYFLNLGYEDYKYLYRHKSLYEIYQKIVSEDRDYEDQFFIEKNEVSTVVLINTIKHHLEKFQAQIDQAVVALEKESKDLEQLHANSYNSLQYAALQMPDVTEKYRENHKKIAALKSGRIVYEVDSEDEYRSSDDIEEIQIINDMRPISVEDIKF